MASSDQARRRRQYFPWGVGNTTFYLTVLALVPAVGIGFVAISESSASPVVAGMASFMVGGVLGFIFGIPRYAASATDKQLQQQADPGVIKYQANTNLEQISDWLTKIIVGVALTQFAAIGDFINSIAEQLGQSLGGEGSVGAKAEALSVLLLTFVSGFLFFYLWSRLYLPKLFQEAETGK